VLTDGDVEDSSVEKIGGDEGVRKQSRAHIRSSIQLQVPDMRRYNCAR
jgi:hypothetical protein